MVASRSPSSIAKAKRRRSNPELRRKRYDEPEPLFHTRGTRIRGLLIIGVDDVVFFRIEGPVFAVELFRSHHQNVAIFVGSKTDRVIPGLSTLGHLRGARAIVVHVCLLLLRVGVLLFVPPFG